MVHFSLRLLMSRAIATGFALAIMGQAHAHAPTGPVALRRFITWPLEPWVLGLMCLSFVLYLVGLARLWRKAGIGHGIGRAQAAAFLLGWLALAAALLSPLDPLGGLLFSAHMVQHELMMVVAAPLLVLGRPLAVWLWSLPDGARRGGARATRWPPLLAAWKALTMPLAAWALHGIVLWAWHMPAMFDAALASQTVHTWQHISFLGSALLFWWAPLGDSHGGRHGGAMFYLFSTMVHTGALGALLTFSPTPWYPAYGDSAASLGFDPLVDQQLGGLIMWVPGGLAYLAVGLMVVARALRPPRWQAEPAA